MSTRPIRPRRAYPRRSWDHLREQLGDYYRLARGATHKERIRSAGVGVLLSVTAPSPAGSRPFLDRVGGSGAVIRQGRSRHSRRGVSLLPSFPIVCPVLWAQHRKRARRNEKTRDHREAGFSDRASIVFPPRFALLIANFEINRGRAMSDEMILVCARVSRHVLLPNNLTGHCAECGSTVQFRPHAPRNVRLRCVECAVDMIEPDDEIITTKRMLDKAQAYFDRKKQ